MNHDFKKSEKSNNKALFVSKNVSRNPKDIPDHTHRYKRMKLEHKQEKKFNLTRWLIYILIVLAIIFFIFK